MLNLELIVLAGVYQTYYARLIIPLLIREFIADRPRAPQMGRRSFLGRSFRGKNPSPILGCASEAAERSRNVLNVEFGMLNFELVLLLEYTRLIMQS